MPSDAVVMRLRQSRPCFSGIDVVRRIKGSASTRHVAVVIITTSMMSSDRGAAHNAECDSYLLLPVVPDQLLCEICRVLRIKRDSSRP